MGCSKCYVGLQFIIWKIQQHEVSFFFWFLHTLLKIIICQTIITCTIYMAIYRYHLYNAKILSKVNLFFWGKIPHHGEKNIV